MITDVTQDLPVVVPEDPILIRTIVKKNRQSFEREGFDPLFP